MKQAMKPATTFPQVLGQVLVLRRRSKKATQHTLANALDLSQSAYSRLERGEAAFNVPQLRRTAAALGTSVSKLFEEAEKGAAGLAKDGVEILEDVPEAQARVRWAWVAPKVIETKVQTVLAQVQWNYTPYTKVKEKEQHVEIQIRRG